MITSCLKRCFWLVFALFPLIAIAGCSRGSGTARLPDFTISVYQGGGVVSGKEVRFSQLFKDGKPVILNFWAAACPPCLKEMPDFQQVYDKHKDKVVLFGLDVGPFVGLGSREEGKALLQELMVTYPAGTTFDAEVVEKYQVIGMPTTVFMKPSGEVFRRWVGFLSADKMASLVEELLAASAKS